MIIYTCRICESENVVRNGHNNYGNPQYYGHSWGTYRVLFPQQISYRTPFKETVLRSIHERSSSRGVERIFNVSRQTVKFGDHSQETCKYLWARIPDAYRRCHSFSNFWRAYQILPAAMHQCAVRKLDRPHIWNAGMGPCGSGLAALSAKPCPFLNRMLSII